MSRKVQAEMCATCPWRKGSPYADLRQMLERSARSEASRICHSTGVNAIMTTKRPELLCRGARNYQLEFLHGIGLLSAPTDEAWVQKCKELGIEPDGGRG